MSQFVGVYCTEHGEHVIPDDVYHEAIELNKHLHRARWPNFALNDWRTRGAKFLEQWSQERDRMLLESEAVQGV